MPKRKVASKVPVVPYKKKIKTVVVMTPADYEEFIDDSAIELVALWDEHNGPVFEAEEYDAITRSLRSHFDSHKPDEPVKRGKK